MFFANTYYLQRHKELILKKIAGDSEESLLQGFTTVDQVTSFQGNYEDVLPDTKTYPLKSRKPTSVSPEDKMKNAESAQKMVSEADSEPLGRADIIDQMPNNKNRPDLTTKKFHTMDSSRKRPQSYTTKTYSNSAYYPEELEKVWPLAQFFQFSFF